MKQVFTYTFKYESDSDSIDLNTLLLSQIHFGTILNEIKAEIAPDTDLKIKIKPLAKGSVPFDIILDLSWLDSLFKTLNENKDTVALIVSTLLNLILIRKELKGRKPVNVEVKDDKVIITTEDTSIEVSRKVYEISQKNATIDVAMKKAFEAIDNDEDVSGIKILDDKKTPLLELPREDFPKLTTPNEVFEAETRTEPSRREALTIFKVVFDKGYKWQFYLGGRKISASINDDAFMERINAGERFAKGDTLVVELEANKVYDKSMDIFIEKDFTVTKVISHTPRPQQDKLFNKSDDEEA